MRKGWVRAGNERGNVIDGVRGCKRMHYEEY